MGCRTGRVLKEVFGDLCEEIIWENASDSMGSHAASRYDPDPDHIQAVIDREKPDVILTFGVVAREGVEEINTKIPMLTAPHPTARGKGVKEKIKSMAYKLHSFEIEKHLTDDKKDVK